MTSGPTLEDFEADMDRLCMDTLGDSIAYAVLGGRFMPKRAYGEFAEAIRDLSTGSVISQDITLEMLVEDLPRRPNTSDRIRISKVPGATFKPVNVRRTQSGTHWAFELEKVSG